MISLSRLSRSNNDHMWTVHVWRSGSPHNRMVSRPADAKIEQFYRSTNGDASSSAGVIIAGFVVVVVIVVVVVVV